jgi:hypothetical protein
MDAWGDTLLYILAAWGGTDIVMRLLARRKATYLGQVGSQEMQTAVVTTQEYTSDVDDESIRISTFDPNLDFFTVHDKTDVLDGKWKPLYPHEVSVHGRSAYVNEVVRQARENGWLVVAVTLIDARPYEDEFDAAKAFGGRRKP